MKNIHWLIIALSLAALPFANAGPQSAPSDSTVALILEKDAKFWEAYNTCDVAKCSQFFTEGVEFYHDKGGITLGLGALMESMKTNLCAGGHPHLRREAVAGTVQVYPMRNGSETYGAIISGEHVFYVIEPEKPERLDGRANFVHLWIHTEGGWKMSRVLSFNHHPATDENKKVAITLPPQRLARFAGVYTGTQSGKITVSLENDTLILHTAKQRCVLFAESDGTFFMKERPLTFQFSPDDGPISELIVRENGSITEKLTR